MASVRTIFSSSQKPLRLRSLIAEYISRVAYIPQRAQQSSLSAHRILYHISVLSPLRKTAHPLPKPLLVYSCTNFPVGLAPYKAQVIFSWTRDPHWYPFLFPFGIGRAANTQFSARQYRILGLFKVTPVTRQTRARFEYRSKEWDLLHHTDNQVESSICIALSNRLQSSKKSDTTWAM